MIPLCRWHENVEMLAGTECFMLEIALTTSLGVHVPPPWFVLYVQVEKHAHAAIHV